jgi:RHS repeat-associated protein
MEKDDEVKGQGNSYDFGARIYDPRVGRFLSLDPLIKDFPNLSPYAYAANNPTLYVDEDGKGPLWFLTDLLQRQLGVTVTLGVTFEAKGGAFVAGEGYTFGGALAKDANGNYAFVGSLGAFYNIMGIGDATSGEIGIWKGGSFYAGGEGSATLDYAVYNFPHVSGLAGESHVFNFDFGEGLAGDVSFIWNEDQQVFQGIEGSIGLGAGEGFGAFNKSSGVFAFTNKDIYTAIANTTEAIFTYSSLNLSDSYSDVSMTFNSKYNSDTKETRMYYSVSATNEDGNVETYEFDVMTITQESSNYAKTSTVSKN